MKEVGKVCKCENMHLFQSSVSNNLRINTHNSTLDTGAFLNCAKPFVSPQEQDGCWYFWMRWDRLAWHSPFSRSTLFNLTLASPLFELDWVNSYFNPNLRSVSIPQKLKFLVSCIWNKMVADTFGSGETGWRDTPPLLVPPCSTWHRHLIVGAFVTWAIYTQGQLLLWSRLITTGVVPGYQ